jgi:hypothetical protein
MRLRSGRSWSSRLTSQSPFLDFIIAMFPGARLFALGMIGEYLSRRHLRPRLQVTHSRFGRPLLRAVSHGRSPYDATRVSPA